jgi:hypothetical protein
MASEPTAPNLDAGLFKFYTNIIIVVKLIWKV